ncbi:hypothetical protein GCM10010168_09530 [Actinoplanes ianthinogenes]|uniref:Uncharacterized protein n=1 Tax=Actinoplanes ianthinogenes TaxID=122358 RepID=A0ABM7LXW0_9ACTN|nr:hypothetical protein [Actinoplanes ianthinogenes]BCJ44140.1 hypothetical protein Aiant_47970 [Actinoplanes ianthinogenes]GGQ96045.1 hypothetical protein GCM10010168_09530 [Actinoplanes ianthinogenes]
MAVNLTERAGAALTRAHGFLHRLPTAAVSAHGPAAAVSRRAGLAICELMCPELRARRPTGDPLPTLAFAGADEPLRRLATGRRQPFPDTTAPAGPDDMPAWALGLLRADPQALAGLAERAALDSLWGCTTTTMATRDRAGWSTALPVALALAAQHRDLALLPALIRAIGYLALNEHPLTTTATALLISQQQPDGGLGILPTGADPHLQTRIRLRLTVSFAWALAEMTEPGFTAAVMSGEVAYDT